MFAMTKNVQLADGKISISLFTDQTIIIRYADDLVVTIEMARDITRSISLLDLKVPFVVLHLPGAYTDVEPGVREYLAAISEKGKKSAEAILIRNLSQRIKANAYLRVQLPACPTYLLHSETEAESWLSVTARG
jgi:hypothetical protein